MNRRRLPRWEYLHRRGSGTASRILRVETPLTTSSNPRHPCRLSGTKRQMAAVKRASKAAPAVLLQQEGAPACARCTRTLNGAAEIGRKGGARNRKMCDGETAAVPVSQ